SGGRIMIISDEGEPYYYRASMSEWLSGELSDEMLPGRTRPFYTHIRLEQISAHVERVDPQAHRVYLDNGTSIGYQKLLIATGARANVFPIPGLETANVFRSLADARQIKEQLGCCGRALIIGGGVLGLELAGALHKMGIEHIAVVQRSGFVGKPLLDQPAAEWLQQRMRADGLDLFLNDAVERVAGQTAYLKSGPAWDFDTLVQAVGITPIFPEVPGLEVGQGIRIDDHGRTNLPDIYAAGDCTETRVPGDTDRWQTTRIWLDCARQGKVAARNMTGRLAALSDQPFFNASLIYTVVYTYLGEPHGQEGQVYLWQENANQTHTGGYRKIRIVDGRLAGALLLGQRHGSMAMFKAIGQEVARIGQTVACPDFDWNELGEPNWDYLFY
ncbi:MAG: FAD-dependent oxidoreductase, partial [Anaerolineae bacterium]|nr:FAD-dependent oxidoreductase [Anaerolineae bacterium]